jgi:hypothetical protein
MKFSSKIRLGLIGVVAAASAFAALPANAQGGLTIAGTGTISPGLTQTGDPTNHYTFSGTGGGVATDNSGTPQAGTFSCTVTGTDTIGSLSAGAGSLDGSCNTPCGTVGVSGSYTRTGPAVTADGSITSGCFSGQLFSVKCTFAPTSPPPVISYTVQCAVTLNIP